MASFSGDIIGSGSVEEAKEHIEKIRDDYGVGDIPRPMANHSLTKALEIIASELYSESTHFLLELIQNANDNDYPDGTIPEVEFEYRNGHLRVDCNEKGFSARNVEAICQIGNSTKAGENKKKENHKDSPIGEKGIGFKSVFKVTDVVYITSRNYSFKFDKNAPLGMVAPSWSDPPQGFVRRAGFTSFYLQLSSAPRKKEVIQQLDKLDVTILTFLRRLRRISVSIEEGRKRVLSREDGTSKSSRTIVLHQDRQARHYIVIEHKVKNLPDEEKRPGISESDIRLAFPLNDGGVPLIKRQQVFAHLPLREYGFQYLIHGDFLALANRGNLSSLHFIVKIKPNHGLEDVDTSSAWNKKLRTAVLEATVKAAHHFNKSSLDSNWFRYLPWETPVYGFFRKAADSIFEVLKAEEVLKNFCGDLKQPSTLCFVPSDFCDANGAPITLTSRSAQRYLSKRYDTADKEALLRLGVTEMTVEVFIEEVRKLIIDDKRGFRSRRREWHSRLALILEQEGKTATNHDLILKLDLIPLRDGRWVSGSEKDVFFPADTVGFAIPGGLRCSLVADYAAQDTHRRLLFQYLGVGKIDSHSLSEAIERWHNIDQNDPGLSLEDLVSQLVFMFNVRWRGQDRNSTLWVVTENKKLRRGCDVYMDADKPSSATTLLDRKKFPFLHTKILDAMGDELRGPWHRWLKESLNISTHPKLIRRVGSGDSDCFELHDDFSHLIQTAPSTIVLQLLRDNWNYYSQFIEHDDRDPAEEEPNLSRSRVRECIQSMRVRCTDDVDYELSRTFLPLKELEKIAHGCIPFVDVPNPDCYSWKVTFHSLGVGYKDDLAFYITCLRGLKKPADPPQQTVCTLLEQIQARSGDEKDRIREVFERRELIYIPRSGGRGFWVRPSRCIWAGPSFMRSVYALNELYPDNKRLFSSLLGLQDATMQHLIQETSQFTTSDDIQYITHVFRELEKFIIDKTTASETVALTRHAMFPVISMADSPRFDCLRSAHAKHEWYIADTTHLAVSFQGILPLLALPLEDIGKLKRVFKMAKVELRKLSHAVEGIASTEGIPMPWPSYTSSLREKANSILRLVPDTEPNRKRTFTQMRNVEAFKAPKVIQSWQVDYNGSPIEGRQETGHVALKFDGDSLLLFFANDSVGTTKVKYELVQRLYNYCGMNEGKEDDREPRFLLTQILDTDSQEQIDEILDRAAVPPLASDEEVDDANNRLNRNYERTGKQKGKHGKNDSIWNSRRTFIEDMIANHTYLLTGKNVLAASLFGPGSRKAGSGAKLFNLDGSKAMEGVSVIRFALGKGRAMGSNWRSRAHANEQVARKGEELIHEVLLSLRNNGLAYDPTKHWTSKRNSQASNGTKGMEEDSDYAAFTFPDSDAVFTYFLTLVGYEPAEKWFSNPPTYHIEVKSTKAGLDDPFDFTRKEFERARAFTASRAADGVVKNVSVLARVFDIEGEPPKQGWLPDVFERYMEGEIKLDAMDDFEGRVVHPS